MSGVWGVGIELAAQVPGEANSIENMAWLEGDWEGPFGGGIFHESWSLNRSGYLEGTGHLVANGDTIETEKLNIRLIHGHLSYIPKVNNSIPVLFVLREVSENKWVFENREHDFPQRMTYIRESRDSLKVLVEGNVDDKPRSIEYLLGRTAKQ